MATTTINYGSWADVTITLASLATSATLLAGREATVIDNTSTKAVDYLVGGHIATGTSPTDLKSIRIYAFADITSTTEYGEPTGADAALTFNDEESRDSNLRLLHVISTDDTSDQLYQWGPFSIADIYGSVPQKIGFWVTHDTGVNLNSTGTNHQISYIPIKYDSA